MTNTTATVLYADIQPFSSPELFIMCTYVTVTCHCHAKHPLTHKINSATTLSCPHLPPIWPLEQTRWVRGRVAHSSLGIAEVLVVTAVSWGRFCQTEGAYRPGRRRPSPKRGEFCWARVRLSHLGFQMKPRGRSPLTECSLFCCCLFSTTVFSQHKETIEQWQQPTSGNTAITVSAMLRLALVWCVSNSARHNSHSHNEKSLVPETIANDSYIVCCSACFRQKKKIPVYYSHPSPEGSNYYISVPCKISSMMSTGWSLLYYCNILAVRRTLVLQ